MTLDDEFKTWQQVWQQEHPPLGPLMNLSLPTLAPAVETWWQRLFGALPLPGRRNLLNRKKKGGRYV